MRRLAATFAALAALLGTFAVVAGPADAVATTPLNREVSGPFTGTATFNFGTPCPVIHQVFDATYIPQRHRMGSVHLDGCVTLGDPTTGSDYTGTFTLVYRNATLHGAVSGVIRNAPPGTCAPGFPSLLTFTLTAEGGTARFRKTTGTIALTGSWCTFGGNGGPINGNVTGHLTHGQPNR